MRLGFAGFWSCSHVPKRVHRGAAHSCRKIAAVKFNSRVIATRFAQLRQRDLPEPDTAQPQSGQACSLYGLSAQRTQHAPCSDCCATFLYFPHPTHVACVNLFRQDSHTFSVMPWDGTDDKRVVSRLQCAHAAGSRKYGTHEGQTALPSRTRAARGTLFSQRIHLRSAISQALHTGGCGSLRCGRALAPHLVQGTEGKTLG